MGRLMTRPAWAVALGMALVAVPVMAADRIQVAVDGVVGESLVSGFVGTIDAQSFAIGVSAPFDAATGPGPVVVAPITVTKVIDKTTPVMMQAAGSGRVFKSVVITSAKNGTSAPLAIERVTLTDARVIDWRFFDNAGDPDRGTEQITFASNAMSLAFIPYSSTGQALTPVTGSVAGKQ